MHAIGHGKMPSSSGTGEAEMKRNKLVTQMSECYVESKHLADDDVDSGDLDQCDREIAIYS